MLLVRDQLDVSQYRKFMGCRRKAGSDKEKREGQREGKEPRLYRTQSVERTGGTRRKITFSNLQYLPFDRDKLIN